ncbi:Dihydrolipoyllysine-residue acetyltransferase component of pyruvate dehydrogenase complex [Maioricimonas rarisocia]|uniref:Dihydrolipoamide acetyltransferase component of pyruvate dehydrogenase complex n=1 Tax=Maioricimonas rarisocia TaxID=2528026 RepID=A0A517Z8N5_9PLAN|nr:dihydrolipoyllysine-residue acetyltransferase [Maioricimonas rarisocia]QDU38847.1 Dihydrolipoyllysine-residue acetyltransferase component of pyruvate dehydrogenase complex [Maioricimonas rarisocia]
MSTEFKLPSIGEGVESADVAELFVKEGDVLEPGQNICELETEKAVVELPCPHGGRVAKVHVSAGETVEVGQLLLTIEESTAGETGGDSSAPAGSAEETSASEPAEAPATESAPAAETESQAATATASGEVVEFKIPNIGEGVESADVAEVLVSVGDTIEAEQNVLELETEKAVVELPCPHAGTIEKIHVSAGDTVSVGQAVLSIATAGGTGKAKPASAPSGESKSFPPEKSPAKEPKRESAPAERQAASARTPELVSRQDETNGQPPVPAAPSTRRLARQLGVNLREVNGSGPGGRITHDDVQAYVRNRLQNDNVPAVSRGGAPTGLAAGSLAPPPLPDFSKYGEVAREKLNKIARTSAENLTVSWNVIPHVTQHDRADITDIEAARKRFGQGVGKNGPKVTMTAVAIKALATCLQAFPKFNSSLDPETNELVLKKFYNIGCAVDTPNGLVVPVVKDVDRKSILDVAAEINELAAKARDRKLSIDSMQGATCTVTNLGGIGGVAFTPIVNYPEVCILGMARGQKELQLVDGEVRERLMLPLSLSYDHRVINGADAARFMVTLCNMLSDPFTLLSAI